MESKGFYFDYLSVRTIFVFIFTLVILELIRRIHYRRDKPPGPWGFPIVGHLPLLGKNPSLEFLQISRKYGDIFQIRMGSWQTIVLNSRRAMCEALLKQFEIFSDRPGFFSSKVVNDMRGLAFGSYTPRWRLHSKIASSVLREFASSKRPSTEQTIIRAAEELVHNFLSMNQKPFNPHEEILLVIGSVIYQLCYGMDKNCRNDKVFKFLMQNTKTIEEFAGAGNPIDVMPWLRYLIPKTANRFVEILHTFHDSTAEVVKEHRQTYDENHLRDLTDGLIQAEGKYTKDTKKYHGITSADIFSILQDFVEGGLTTTSSTLEWIILYIAHYTDVQTKIQNEIENVIGTRKVTLEDMGKLPYTESTILEIQRMSPAVCIGIPHATSKDTLLRNYKIRKGTVVLCNFYAITRDSLIWKNPEVFLPERFLNDNLQIIPSVAEELLTFSIGRRRCPGDSLAKMELFLIVVNMLQKCRISITSEPDFEGLFGLICRPKPYFIKVISRQ